MGGDIVFHKPTNGIAKLLVILFKQGARYRQHEGLLVNGEKTES